MRANKIKSILSITIVLLLVHLNAYAGFLTIGVKNNLAKSEECSGWNCGIASDANAQSWYFFTGYSGYDNKGSYTLTNNGTSLDTTDFIVGTSSQNFESDDPDSMTRTGSTSDWGWASANALSITFWFKTESTLAANTPFFVKGVLGYDRCVDIEHAYSNYMRFRVDGDDDGTWENYTFNQAYTDNQWYFFALTINATTDAYYAQLYGYTEDSIIETISGTLTDGIANLDVAGNIYLGNNSGSTYYDGHLDEMVIWNKVLNTTEISEIRQGTFK